MEEEPVLKRRRGHAAKEDPAAAKDGSARYTAIALERGLLILELLAEAHAALPLAEIARRAGLTRGVAFRLMHTLERAGYLQRVDKVPSFRPGARVMSLGFAYLRSLGLAELTRPYLERLRDTTGASAHLGVLDGRDVFYVARVAARLGAVSYLDIGDRSPAHASAIGQAMLASFDPKEVRQLYRGVALTSPGETSPKTLRDLETQLAVVRQRGYAVSVGALHANVVAVAAGFRNAEGKIAGALSVTSLDPARLRDEAAWAAAVTGVAGEISRALGYVEFPAQASLDAVGPEALPPGRARPSIGTQKGL